MDYLEVRELLNAGFTADEIRGMFSNPTPDPEPAHAADPEPAPDPEHASDPQPAHDPESEDLRFTALNDTMNKILKAIQGNNLQNNSIANMGNADLDTQVDKIMGSLIRPEHTKEEK